MRSDEQARLMLDMADGIRRIIRERDHLREAFWNLRGGALGSGPGNMVECERVREYADESLNGALTPDE